ncbi:hypothetical protein PISL3812_09819 [Talaromyces islandicus]|uniref:Uncharacterized protein n=1 Tax=Talaromyces islandicus TaxID=28573 RepID=A0A0U1MBQ7_TALIS|nr:hypothetical protein PISL3812_09819 [Talaromyces islandicus]
MSTPTTSKRNTTNNNTNEADIIFNRANVALARSQRLVASWLPPAAADEKQKGESESDQAELQRLEDEMFTPVPERLGLGAPIPKQQGAADKLWNKTELSADDKLRQTLLGRNYKKIQEQKQAAVAAAKNRASGPGSPSLDKHNMANNNNYNNGGEGEDDEEEEGRSALGKSKKIKVNSSSSLANEKNEDEGTSSLEQSGPKKSKTASKRKGAGSFLDDLLSDRKKKRKK